jgi:putative membrane protein
MKKTKKKEQLLTFIDWLIKIVGYAIILFVTSLIFKETLHIDNNYFGLWSLLAALIIYLLNKTLKPILIWLTIPITGLTLGLFYPFINLIILKLVSLILYPHFYITGIFYAIFASILISLLNVLLEDIIQKNRKD